MPNFAPIDRPLRRVNKKAIYFSIGVAIAGMGLVLLSIPSNKKQESLVQAEPVLQHASASHLMALESIPKTYEEAQKQSSQTESTPAPSNSENFVEHTHSRRTYRQRFRGAEQERVETEYFEATRSSGIFINKHADFASKSTRRNDFDFGTPLGPMKANELGNLIDKNSESRIGKETKYLNGQMARHSIAEGTILHATLLTEVNTQLPGPVLAHITHNIYNTRDGRYLLIPQGSKLVGKYNSNTSYGQDRLQIVWTRLILPNTSSIDLENMPGIDARGASGQIGQVNNHYDKVAAAVLVSTLMSAATKSALKSDQHQGYYKSPQDVVGESLAQESLRAGTKLLDKSLDIQPTIKLPISSPINVFVMNDLILEPYSN